jgi:hypothetical protein
MRQPEKWGAASQTTAVPSPEGYGLGVGGGFMFLILCALPQGTASWLSKTQRTRSKPSPRDRTRSKPSPADTNRSCLHTDLEYLGPDSRPQRLGPSLALASTSAGLRPIAIQVTEYSLAANPAVGVAVPCHFSAAVLAVAQRNRKTCVMVCVCAHLNQAAW